jgi:hypothetical protein
MWWFAGFVVLLLIALRIDFKIGVKGFDQKEAPCSCHSASPALGGW